MTYQRFEDVPVWQEAARLYEAAEGLLNNNALAASRGFRDQLERAALSVSNNIAEGFERGTTNELIQFLHIARGSAGEVRSMITVKMRRVHQVDLKSQMSDLISLAASCSRQLRGWTDSLQNSDIKGPRHLNDKARREDDQKRRAAAFQKDLLRRLPAGHPLRQDAAERGLL